MAFTWVRIWIIASLGVSKVPVRLFTTRIVEEVACIHSKLSRMPIEGSVQLRIHSGSPELITSTRLKTISLCRGGAKQARQARISYVASSYIPVVMACVCSPRSAVWMRRHLAPFVPTPCQILTPVLHLLCISGCSAAAPRVLKIETRLASQEQAFPKHLSSLPTGIPQKCPWGCVWNEYLWRHGLELAQYIPQLRYIA